MFDSEYATFIIRFVPEFYPGESRPYDLRSVVPATHLGNVVTLTSDLARSTWDYALSHPNDERFRDVRRLEAVAAVKRRDIELVIVAVRPGSLEVTLDWLVAVLGTSILTGLPQDIAGNALWDLIKYGWGVLLDLRRRREDRAETDDPLANELLSQCVQLARAGFSEFAEMGRIATEFRYRGPEHEFSVKIDYESQQTILEANQVYTHSTTRLVGSVVGLDYSQGTVAIQFEQFPDEPMWCDVQGIDLSELGRYLPSQGDLPKPVGFDAEVAWRQGAVKVFPPDSIRILQIVPEDALYNPDYHGPQRLKRTPIFGMKEGLSPEDEKLLEWLSWADRNWTDPNLGGIVKYLQRNSQILGRSYSRKEIVNRIERFIEYGILMRTRDRQKRDPFHQVLRLNRNHPMVIKYLGRT